MDREILRRAYNAYASGYDLEFEALQTPKLAGLLAALPHPLPEPIADLGAGTGLLRRRFAVPAVQIDIAEGMLRHAEGPRAVGALEALPLASGVFGVAFCVTALVSFQDPTPVLAELARILKPGGWLALSVLAIDQVGAVASALPEVGLTPLKRFEVGQDVAFVARRADD